MICLYFTVRSQDDRVDEGGDPKQTYLEDALRARAARLLIEVAGDTAAMLEEWERSAAEFGVAAYQDAEKRLAKGTIWDEAAIALQGAKYLPMSLPLAALLIGAGRARDLPALRACVLRLGTGLQLTNDIFGADRDLEAKLGSPFLASLKLAPGDAPTALLPAARRALRKNELGKIFEIATAALREGLEPLAHLSSRRLAIHVEARILELQAHYRRLCMEALFKVPQIIADLEITRRCNLRCPACFVFAQEEKGHKLPELPTPLLLEILEELGGYQALLHLTGGEAFLHRGIWEVLEAAPRFGMGEALINTNGSFLDEKSLGRLAALAIKVRLLVSIDGPPGVQETARGEGMTKKALDAIRIGHRLGISAEPATILTAELVDYGVDRWFEYLRAELGRAPKLVLWPIFLKPETTLTPAEGGSSLDAAHLWAAAQQIAKLMLAGHDVEVADYPVINPLLARLGVPVERLWQCNAGRGRLAVQADRSVTPCHPFQLPIGHIAPGEVRGFVDRTLHHPKYTQIGRRESEGCTTCPEQSICGNCQAVVVGKGGALFSNDHFCDTVIGPPETRARKPAEGRTKPKRLPVLP